MHPRRHVRLLLAFGLIAGLLTVTIGPVIKASSISARSIQGQDGWSGGTLPVSASIDQVVDQSGLNQRTGTGAWRISNNTSLGGYNGNFAGWVFSPGLPVSAGQPSSGAVANQFTATLWFRSASPSADGSNIEIDLGNPEGNDRNTFLAVTNRADGVDGGLQLRVSEPEGATGNFLPTLIVATGITRGVYHRLDILAKFQDGLANDTVEYALDGVPLANPGGGTTFGTFEGWRDGLQFAYSQSNRLFFRSGAPPSSYGAFVDTAAQGFYFDDLFYAVANQSAPAIRLAAYATGFEPGFSAGSIQGQEAWSGGTLPIAASVDQAVDQSGVKQRTGTGAWRISNNTLLGGYNGNFAGWVFSPGLPVSAGQPSSGAVANQFTATLWFRSASPSADGSNIEIDLGNPEGNDRNTFLAVTNRADGVDGGLQLRVSEPEGATGNFLPTLIVATGITRGVYHRLDILAKFQDGLANDTVEYALDGVPLANPGGGTTFGTFEGWRDGLQFAYSQSNRLFFRSGAPPSSYGAFVDTAAQGFFFDDLFYSVANQSAPGTGLAAYATGFEPPLIPAPDLTITKSHVGNFMQGQIGAQFTITVTNIGTPSTIGVVTLTDALPSGLTPTAASGAGWTCTVTGATVTCTGSDALAPGAGYPPVTITVNVAANAPASVANTATISGGGDVNTANNTATDVTTILPGASQVDLGVTKTDGHTTYTPGTPISYTITVTNAGPSTATGFSIADNVPATITAVTVACAVTGTGNCGANGSSGNSVTFTGASVAPGAGNTLTLTVNGTLTTSASGTLVNTATVTAGAGSTDLNTGNNTATDTDTNTPTPEPGVTEITSFFAYDPVFPGGVNVAVGDVNGDGLADIITAAGPGGGPHVRIWSGADFSELGGFFAYDPAFPGGVNVAAGDVNGDGLADIITGAGPGGGPHVRIWSGADFSELGGFFAYNPAFPGGVKVAAADVNGDGLADIITGAGPGGGPHVRIWSGADFSELGGFFAYDPAFPGGVNVAAADVNGDGLADIITGVGPGGGPHVRIWSGADFSELFGFFAYDPAFPGGVNVAAGDVDGDGLADIITGVGPGGGPHVRIWSGADFSELFGFFAYDPAFPGGVNVAAGDVNGDGLAEILTGVGPGPPPGPHVRVFRYGREP